MIDKIVEGKSQGYKQVLIKPGCYTSCHMGEDDYRLLSEKWKKLRDARLKKDGYRCQKCGTAIQLNVHHIRYPKVWGSESIDELITLCDKCHNETHETDKGGF